MSKSTTAADVRNFFRADAKRLARLSDDAAKTVREGARGRLHPEVISTYNKGRKADRHYVSGASTREAIASKGEAQNLRVAAAEAGLAVGVRGPLSKAAKEALGMKVKATKK